MTFLPYHRVDAAKPEAGMHAARSPPRSHNFIRRRVAHRQLFVVKNRRGRRRRGGMAASLSIIGALSRIIESPARSSAVISALLRRELGDKRARAIAHKMSACAAKAMQWRHQRSGARHHRAPARDMVGRACCSPARGIFARGSSDDKP